MSVLTDFYANANRQMPLRWVSGNSYALDADVWSSVSGHIYRRIVAGAGTTDPSADATNWMPVCGGIKSIQRVAVVVSTSNTVQTSAITSINTARATIEIIGQVCSAPAFVPSEHQFHAEIVSATSVRVTRFNASANSVTVMLQVVEWW